MNSDPQWHYTDANNQQTGPISEPELKNLIIQGSVPTSGMAWKEGMSDWQIIDQIQALQTTPTAIATPTPETPQNQPTAQNPYAPPTTDTTLPNADTYEIPHTGGIGRLAYFLLSLGIGVAQQVLIFAFASAAVATNSGEAVLGVSYLVIIIAAIGQLFVAGYRYKNIGYNPWWALLYIVPIISLIVAIRCLVYQQGYVYTRKLDKAGKIIAWILGGLVIGGILLAILAVAIST